MPTEGKGRLLRRKDGKCLIYLPLALAEDSVFPWKGVESVKIKASFESGGEKKLTLNPLNTRNCT